MGRKSNDNIHMRELMTESDNERQNERMNE